MVALRSAGGQLVALRQRGGILAHGEAFRFLQERLQIFLLQIGRHLLVVLSVGAVSGQFQLVH